MANLAVHNSVYQVYNCRLGIGLVLGLVKLLQISLADLSDNSPWAVMLNYADTQAMPSTSLLGITG